MTLRILPLRGRFVMILQIHLLLEGPVMTPQIHLLLGGPTTVSQISLLPEGPVIAPLTQLNLEGLLILWIDHSSGGPIIIPLTWLLMFLTHCSEPKAVKPQKALAKLLHIGRGQDLLIHHSQRIANMSMTQTSLLHEKSRQYPMLEVSNMILKALPPPIGNITQALHPGNIRVTHWTLLPTQGTVGKPLIQIFLLHGTNRVQGPRIPIPICHLRGIDLGIRALILTSLHQGESRGPNLLILICLHLEGASLWERRLHTCTLGLKLGWC